MPASSKAQQRFFGVVKSMQKGDKPKEGEAGKVAKSMKKKDVDDFASTKHKGKPEKVKREQKVRELIKKMVREELAKMNEDDTVEVQPDFELIAFDFVSNPSTHGAFLSPTNEGKLNEGVGTRDGICCHDCKIENIINDIFRGE